MEPIIDIWTGCYPSRWKGMIVPEAIVHPAKFSSRLIARIYHHMLDEGWLKAGDVVLDPFAGVALGALDAMRLGLHWRGVELERKFADLGNANIEYWNRRFSKNAPWGEGCPSVMRNQPQFTANHRRGPNSRIQPALFGSAHRPGDRPSPGRPWRPIRRNSGPTRSHERGGLRRRPRLSAVPGPGSGEERQGHRPGKTLRNLQGERCRTDLRAVRQDPATAFPGLRGHSRPVGAHAGGRYSGRDHFPALPTI